MDHELKNEGYGSENTGDKRGGLLVLLLLSSFLFFSPAKKYEVWTLIAALKHPRAL